jgi:hypothetical protein
VGEADIGGTKKGVKGFANPAEFSLLQQANTSPWTSRGEIDIHPIGEKF